MIAIQKIPQTKEKAQIFKVTETIMKEPIEGTDELQLEVQSGFYASFIVTAINNYPNNKVNNILKLEEQFQDILLKKKNTYILGDLNFDMVDKITRLHNIIKQKTLTKL